MDVRTRDRIGYLSPHQLPFLILLLMVLGNGRDSFFNIKAGCEVRRWRWGGDNKIAANGGVGTGRGAVGQWTGVNIKGNVKGARLRVRSDHVWLLRLELGAGEDVARRGEGRLESLRTTVPQHVAGHLLFVRDTAKDMIAPAVMELSTAAGRSVVGVEDGQAELPKERRQKHRVPEAVARDAAAHCDQG